MTAKYEHIATITLDSSASSVTFSSIPQGYRDLELIINGIYSAGAAPGSINAYFNNDTGSNYPQVYMLGTGSSASSGSNTNTQADLGFSGNETMQVIAQIQDYSATDKHKTVLSRSDGSRVEARATRWANTSAINEIDVFTTSADFQAGHTFDLYGIVGGA